MNLSEKTIQLIREEWFGCLPAPLYSKGPYFNTDIIIWKDGSVTTNNYFGSISYRDENILYVINVSDQDKISWIDLWTTGLTEEQKEFAISKKWDTVYETDSDNPEDWQEFKITSSDFIENSNFLETIEEIERVEPITRIE